MKSCREKRLEFIFDNGLVGIDENNLYWQARSALNRYAAVDKYQGWILPLNRFNHCALIVADTILWMFERENRPIYDKIDGSRLTSVRDDVRAAIKKAFRAMIDAAKRTTDSTIAWTVPELMNVTFRRLKY